MYVAGASNFYDKNKNTSWKLGASDHYVLAGDSTLTQSYTIKFNTKVIY